MPEQDVVGRRPNRFRDAIFAGPVRGLEQWGALTADDWATAGTMLDENPHWNVQHVIEHFIAPASPPVEPASPPVEPAAVVGYPPVSVPRPVKKPRPVRPRVVAPQPPVVAPQFFLPLPPVLTFLPPEVAPEPTVIPFEAPVIAPERPSLLFLPPVLAPEPSVLVPELPVLTFLPPVLDWNFAAEVLQEDQAREHLIGLPVEVPLVPGPLPETYVLTPLSLWEARHNVPEDVWASKVTQLVEAYGPFPDRVVIIVSIRYSRGRELGKDQYDSCVERCIEAASTLIRHLKSLQGQGNRQFLIYPWIRNNIGSADNWFKTAFYRYNFRNGIPRTTQSSCRLKELEFVLDNVQPGTEVWWLSIGIDALTTDIDNLRRVQARWPAPVFTVAIIVHETFRPNASQFGSEDICPPRPAASGMRIRMYSFARLLTGARNFGDAPASKLLAVWQYINDAKLNQTPYDKSLAMNRNAMPVSPEGLGSPYDRM